MNLKTIQPKWSVISSSVRVWLALSEQTLQVKTLLTCYKMQDLCWFSWTERSMKLLAFNLLGTQRVEKTHNIFFLSTVTQIDSGCHMDICVSGCAWHADPFFRLSNSRAALWQQQHSLTTHRVRHFLPACQHGAVCGSLSFFLLSFWLKHIKKQYKKK